MRSAGHLQTLLAIFIVTFGVLEHRASAQFFGSRTPAPPMKKAADIIHRGQPPAKVEKSLESVINPENSHVIISLSKQRA